MAITPEQFVQGLRRRGIRIDLEAEEPEPRFRLSGPKEQITERIREYIRRNRTGIYALFGQARCNECFCLLDEHDDNTYHLTGEGELYCIGCWLQLTKPPPDAWELEAEAFLTKVLNELGFSVFGPFAEQQVMHLPTGSVWSPGQQKEAAQEAEKEVKKPHRAA